MIRLVPTIVAVLVVAAGCAAQDAGPRTTEPAFPARPVEIAVAGVDPCAMFNRAQQRALGLRNASPRQAIVNGAQSPGCVWLGKSDVGYNTQTIPIAAEVAMTEPDATTIEVNGFGAIRTVVREMTGGIPTCQVTVDAASGHSIRVQAQASRTKPSDDEICRLATEAASMVMTTVVKSSG